jgi:hypothetical protein
MPKLYCLDKVRISEHAVDRASKIYRALVTKVEK